MLNPLDVTFTALGRVLDLLIPRPEPRRGAPIGWHTSTADATAVAVRPAREPVAVDEDEQVPASAERSRRPALV